MAFYHGIFGLVAYCYFFWVLPLAGTSFMINGAKLFPELAAMFNCPYNIDHAHAPSPLGTDLAARVLTNVALLGAFAIPHSVLARGHVKDAMGLSDDFERTFYVFQSSALLHLLLHYWQPIAEPVWTVAAGPLQSFLTYFFFFGWAWLVSATFSIDHFGLFGLRQSLGMGTFLQMHEDGKFSTAYHHSIVRHPIMLGFFIMLFSIPAMTQGHLLFSAACSAYILLAVTFLEEPDLLATFGRDYANYQKTTPAYCPFNIFGGTRFGGTYKDD